jgi:RHS repeat-associated protein
VYKFTGKELDSETGLYYLGARYYSPVDGIFLSVDPLAGSFPSWGPYVYTLNNPVRLVDPDGNSPEPPVLGFGAYLRMSLGTGGLSIRGGLSASVSANYGSVQAAGVGNFNFYNRGVGASSEGGWGFDASVGAGVTAGWGGNDARPMPNYIGNVTSASSLQNTYQNSVTYGQAMIFSKGLYDEGMGDNPGFQRNGVIGARFGGFSFSSHNDTDFYGGGGSDKGFTGGMRLSVDGGSNGLLHFGTEVYTGTPYKYIRNQEYNPSIEGIREYVQTPFGRTLNNATTFGGLSYPGGNGYSVFSQGKGNFWFQRLLHLNLTKNRVFSEGATPKTEIGGGYGCCQ